MRPYANICNGLKSSHRTRASRITFLPSTAGEQLQLRQFSASKCRCRRKPSHPSVSLAEYERIKKEQTAQYKAYSPADKKELALRYTPEQLEAIEAGEAAISVEDLATQGRLRTGPWAFKYVDDFSKVQPVIDKKIGRIRNARDGETGKPFTRALNPDEALERIGDALLKPDPERPLNSFDKLWGQVQQNKGVVNVSPLVERVLNREPDETLHEEEATRFLNAVSSSQPTPENEKFDDSLQPAPNASSREQSGDQSKVSFPFQKSTLQEGTPEISSAAFDEMQRIIPYVLEDDSPYVAPTIPKIDDPTVKWGDEGEDAEGIDSETRAMYSLLSKQTGHDIATLQRFRVKNLVAHRVVNQTRLGKIQSMYYLTIAGNQNGLLGVGEGKAVEPEDARRTAMLAAIRNMKPIPRYENRTIFGTVKGKVGAVELSLSARPPGFGVRTQHLIFEMARCAGITDLAGKLTRSRNPMNVAKAAWQALLSQKDPEDIARARGRKLVDVRKVYYAGEV